MKRIAVLAALLCIVVAGDAAAWSGSWLGVQRVERGTVVEAQATISQPTCTFANPADWCAAWVAIQSAPPWSIVQAGVIIVPWLWGMEPHAFWAAGDTDTGLIPFAQDLGPLYGAHHFRVRIVTTDWTGRRYDRIQFYVDEHLVAYVPIASVPWVLHAATAAWHCEAVVPADRCAVWMTNARVRVAGGPSMAAFRGWVGYREPRLRVTSSTSLLIGP